MSKRIRNEASIHVLSKQIGRLSRLTSEVPGLSHGARLLLSRIEHYTFNYGSTFIGNPRLAADLNRSERTISRHIRELTEAGVSLAVFGMRGTPCKTNPFSAYTRWLLALGPRFPEGLKRAADDAGGQIEFIPQGALTDRDKVIRCVWAFLGVQGVLYPGSAEGAAAAFYEEVGVIPPEIEFSERFDADFFWNLARHFCPWVIAKIGNQKSGSSKEEPSPQTPPPGAGGASELKPQATIPGLNDSLNQASVGPLTGAAAQAEPPMANEAVSENGSAHKKILCEIIPELDYKNRRLAFVRKFPAVAVIISEILKAEDVNTWSSEGLRSLAQALDGNRISVRHFEIIRDHSPHNGITFEKLSQGDTFYQLLSTACIGWRQLNFSGYYDWEIEMKIPDVDVIPMRSLNQNLSGLTEIREGNATGDELDNISLPHSWAFEIAIWGGYAIHNAPGREIIKKFSHHFSDHLLIKAISSPLAWRTMIHQYEAIGSDTFFEIYGFTAQQLFGGVLLYLSALRTRACGLQAYKFVNEYYGRGNADCIEHIPDPENYSEETLARYADIIHPK